MNFELNPYLMIKWIHIISSVLMVGTGFGTAFYLYFCNRTKNIDAIAEVSRLVVKADTWFTTPAVIIQPLSGVILMYMAGWTWDTPWIMISIGLYLVVGLCWLPVVYLQIKLRDMAQYAQQQHNTSLPTRYWRFARIWEYLGYPAFVMTLMIFYLMVNKP